MSTFKTKQAKYSRRIHASIDAVSNQQWRMIRDTAIEIAAGVAALVELAGEMFGHLKIARAAARA